MLAADCSNGTCERQKFLLSSAASPRPHLGLGLRRRVGRSRRQAETAVGACPLLEFGRSRGGGGFRGVAGCRRSSLVLEGVPGKTLYHVEQVLHVGVYRHVCHTQTETVQYQRHSYEHVVCTCIYSGRLTLSSEILDCDLLTDESGGFYCTIEGDS